MRKREEQLIPIAPRKKGRWLIIEGCTYCSVCRCNYKKAIMKHSNFCPNCGADMRGEKINEKTRKSTNTVSAEV